MAQPYPDPGPRPSGYGYAPPPMSYYPPPPGAPAVDPYASPGPHYPYAPSLPTTSPAASPVWAPGLAGSMEPARPAAVTMVATMAVTASLQWVCALSMVWLVAGTARTSLGVDGFDGAVFHLFDRLHHRLLDGLAWPLYLFPLVSFTTGFLLLWRRPWTRIAHTAIAVAALAWSAWWLRDNLTWWLVPAAYVITACLLLWTPGASRWYGWRSQSPQRW